VGIARHGIGVSGAPVIALAVARGIVLDCVAHADPAALRLQLAGAERELAWMARLAGRVRRAPLPPGVSLAVRIANGASTVGRVLVAERETELGERLAAVVRVGVETIELDRREGTPPVPVTPRLVSLAEAGESSRLAG